MEKIPLPRSLTTEPVSTNRAKVIIEPCYPGYGTTLGNALRRVLLSSLPGAAVTAIRIIGAEHEFSSLPGVQEDAVDLLLNVKQLRIQVHSAEPVVFKLKATGEREVTAADITATSDVDIMNKELHLATLTDKKASLEIEFTASQGRGYVPVESRDKEKLNLGTIAVDALYTPVQRVGYTVDDVRVGQMTNYEKLVLDVETDGSITPLQAVQEASRILIEHFEVLVGGAQTETAEQGVVEEIVGEEPKEAEDVKVGKKRGRPKKDEI